MRWFVLTLAMVVVGLSATGVSYAAPVAGTFDSRDAGSTILLSFWEDSTDIIGMFTAHGYLGTTQWYIEAQDPDWNGGWCGYLQLNSGNSAPWLGDDPAQVGGYEGQITAWTLDKDITYGEGGVIEHIDLVLKGTAVLDQVHLEPWYDWDYEDMAPVPISFELGFSGVPDEGYIGGVPDYLVITVVPEPNVLMMLVAIGLSAAFRVRRRK